MPPHVPPGLHQVPTDASLPPVTVVGELRRAIDLVLFVRGRITRSNLADELIPHLLEAEHRVHMALELLALAAAGELSRSRKGRHGHS